jgi:hypothetical protein
VRVPFRAGNSDVYAYAMMLRGNVYVQENVWESSEIQLYVREYVQACGQVVGTYDTMERECACTMAQFLHVSAVLHACRFSGQIYLLARLRFLVNFVDYVSRIKFTIKHLQQLLYI